METLVAELQEGAATEEVTVAAYCDKNEFTETRTANYGLSDGSTKVEEQGTAKTHQYKAHDGIGAEGETVYVCEICNVCTTDAPVEPEVALGDVNGDGKVNAKDALLLKQYCSKYDVELNLDVADVKADGVINAKDALLLAQYVAKYDVELGQP